MRLNFGGTAEPPTILSERDATHACPLIHKQIKSLQKAVVIGATTTVAENIWRSFPTYASYVNMEELYDVDEVKELYLQAARKRGW